MPRPDKADQLLFESGLIVRLASMDADYGADPVLHNVDFEIRAGEAAIITGPTSAGKSSLLHVLRLALAPSEGHALILGADAAHLSAKNRARLKRQIGYVAENPVFVEHWTAFDNIALPLRLSGMKPKEYEQDVEELVDFVGLGTAANAPAAHLSGAARRRAAIARALATKPALLLADDPTAGMSPEGGRRMVKLLAEMRRVGAAVVIVSQDESLGEDVPAARWRLEHGRLAPQDISEPAGAEAYR
jgi:cell division transport system ATP-binding protein